METKEEIINGLRTTLGDLTEIIQSVDNEHFVAKPISGKWSIAEEFDHILKSNVAVASALKRSPLLFRWKFGKPNRPLRKYDEVFERYFEKLTKVPGAVAPAAFISAENQTFDKSDMINHWTSTIDKLEVRIKKWSDKSLNKTILPHPLLGKMIMREMLFFTDFHTKHHLKSIKAKASDNA